MIGKKISKNDSSKKFELLNMCKMYDENAPKLNAYEKVGLPNIFNVKYKISIEDNTV